MPRCRARKATGQPSDIPPDEPGLLRGGAPFRSEVVLPQARKRAPRSRRRSGSRCASRDDMKKMTSAGEIIGTLFRVFFPGMTLDMPFLLDDTIQRNCVPTHSGEPEVPIGKTTTTGVQGSLNDLALEQPRLSYAP